jgi:hypothetical protein
MIYEARTIYWITKECPGCSSTIIHERSCVGTFLQELITPCTVMSVKVLDIIMRDAEYLLT